MCFIKATLMILFCFHLFNFIQTAPYFGIDDDDDGVHDELRRKHKMKKKRPCGRNDEGKTFLPFQFSYVNVNYNYNCGGASNSPNIHDDDDTSDDHRPHKPHRPLNNHHFVNSKPLADPLNEDDANTEQNKPNRPNKPLMNFLQNHNNGGFLGLFDGSFISSLFGTKPKPSTSTEEIPVHEDLDDVVQDATEKLSPGQFITAYNPLTGQYLQEVSNFKPKRILKRISNILVPIYDIF